MRWRLIPILLILGGGLWTALGQYILPSSMDGETSMGGLRGSHAPMTMGGVRDSDMGMTMGGLSGHSATVFCWVAGGVIALCALLLLAGEVRAARSRPRAAAAPETSPVR
jgi:hypothetical protein